MYVGETGCLLAKRFGKHRHDIKSRPDNNELAILVHQDDHDLEVMILQTGLSKSRAEREDFQDKWICKLQTKVCTGINEQMHNHAKEMYQCFKQ